MQGSQISGQFVGRQTEIDLFKDWLLDDSAPDVLYIHDETSEQEKKGGIGKTWLLKEFMRQARIMRPDLALVSVDFFNVTDRDRMVIVERVVKSLQEAFPDWPASASTKALNEYFGGSYVRGVPAEKEADVRIRDALSDALALDLQDLENMLHGSSKFLVLFFDTFEVIEDNPVIAVLGSNQSFPDLYRSRRVGAVVAGRNALNLAHPNWRERAVKDVALTPFDPQEMLDYLNTELLSELVLSAEETRTLYTLTAGRPILIGLVTDVLNHQVMSFQELLAVPYTRFEERLVAQVNRLENPLNWVILFMAHIYHRFNMETLDWIAHHSNLKYTQGIDYAALIKSLPDLSFVRQSSSGKDFVLHDEMRRLVTLYCWEVQDGNKSIRRELSRCIIAYCEHQKEQRLSEQEQQLYSIMKLYHLLFLNLEEGLNYFEEESRRAVNAWRSAFARSLLQEVRLFSSALSQEQQYMLIFAGARLLRSEENTPVALREHERLQREASPEWYAEHATEILIEKGRCYLLVSQLREAGDCFSQALALGRARSDVAPSTYLLNMLGFIHRRRGELDKALEFYNECIAVQKAAGQEVAYADTLNNISNVYRLKGRTEEALRVCKISLNRRQRLVQEGKTSERAVALSLNTLGLIYLDSGNYMQAEQSLLAAFDIYSRYGDKRSMAMLYSRLGRVHMATGDLVRAKELFEQAREASEDVNPEALVASLNRQGRIYLLQNQWEVAIPLFQRAIAVADQIHDSYQRVENLLYYATALERLNRPTEAQELWQQIYELSSQENYLLLRARAENARGDIFYDAGDLTEAFAYYGRYCQYAVQFNLLEYNTALRKISDRLLEVPQESVQEILNSLLAFWAELGYEEVHPELPLACQQIQQFISP